MKISLKALFSSIVTISLLTFGYQPVFAADLDLEGSNSLVAENGVALPITDLQISGTTEEVVPVKLLTTSGSLSMGTTTGLTFTGASTGSELYFEGSLENVNNALATLTYTRASTGTDTLEVSLVSPGEVFFEGTGHLYEYIADSGTWNAAKTKAENLTRYGSTGYLATIQSAGENAFVADRLEGAGWMGASDSSIEGAWKWVTGPVAEQVQFWSGNGDGSTVGGNYANWNEGEPNDSSGEDCGQFLAGGTGKWNDLNCGSSILTGYVAEFGGPGDEPDVVAKNITITTKNRPTISTLLPADNATDVAETNEVTITFNQNIEIGTGNIILKKSSDDSVVETIGVTSDLVSLPTATSATISFEYNFISETGYYVQIDAGAFSEVDGLEFAGISNATTWNFTTADYQGPIISNVSETDLTNRSAIINWETDEAASGQIEYGYNTGINDFQADLVTDLTLDHQITIDNLYDNQIYYYRITSADALGNSTTSAENTFKTIASKGGNALKSQTSTPKESNADKQTSERTSQSNTDDESVWQKIISKLTKANIVIPEITDLTTPIAVITDVRDLTINMTGEDVKLLQTLLINNDYQIPAGATGLFFNQTQSALAAYQADNDIQPAIGYFGIITRNQMKESGIGGLWW